MREGWPDFFLADQKIYERTNSQIQGIAKSLTGAGDSVAQKMASTFKAFSDKADWLTGPQERQKFGEDSATDEQRPDNSNTDEYPGNGNGNGNGSGSGNGSGAGLFELHHDIHIHLPPTTEVSVYRAIFQAIKAELM